MKNRKNLVLIGVAVCIALLASLTSPVLASADETLNIYGNANMDDTIDVCDITYTARIFFELEDSTPLADAYYDGEIDVGDMWQIGLIILGREKKLTIVDAEGAAKTVSKPIEKIIVLNTDCAQAIRAIGAKGRIVGIESFSVAEKKVFFPDISELPTVGWGHMPDPVMKGLKISWNQQ
jgi:iron complex transport system substrate-binding protein